MVVLSFTIQQITCCIRIHILVWQKYELIFAFSFCRKFFSLFVEICKETNQVMFWTYTQVKSQQKLILDRLACCANKKYHKFCWPTAIIACIFTHDLLSSFLSWGWQMPRFSQTWVVSSAATNCSWQGPLFAISNFYFPRVQIY